MNLLAAVRNRVSAQTIAGFGLAVAGLAFVIILATLDTTALRQAARNASDQPLDVAVALGFFGLAFFLRALAWQTVVPALSFRHALSAIHLALGGNHVLPFRLGEPLRVWSVVRRQGVDTSTAAASTVALRIGDMLCVVAIGAAAAPVAYFDIVGPVVVVPTALLLVGAAVAWRWIEALSSVDADSVVRPGLRTIGLTAAAWLFETMLVYRAAEWAGLAPSWSDAIVVTTVAVAAQVIAIAPGGFGTYEAAAVAAWVALGHAGDAALVAALLAHGLKTAYSLAAGLAAVAWPSPSLFGRLRLSPVKERERQAPILHDGEVLLFMPAHNEEAAVGACIDRTPSETHGRPVSVLIIDDGSTDATADVARRHGAEVVSFDTNQGLGAAVRHGLAHGVRRESAVVVFCDADGEYPPEELNVIVAPILSGEADYVAGSRFLGEIEYMRPHRRFGNLVLTRLLSVVARRRITDGHSGYRAFSPEAAANAEVIHDFNYAQVITLDLLAKGYRYREVPISYHFRTTGESFIKLGSYLRSVVPAVYRQLNANVEPTTSEAMKLQRSSR